MNELHQRGLGERIKKGGRNSLNDFSRRGNNRSSTRKKFYCLICFFLSLNFLFVIFIFVRLSRRVENEKNVINAYVYPKLYPEENNEEDSKDNFDEHHEDANVIERSDDDETNTFFDSHYDKEEEVLFSDHHSLLEEYFVQIYEEQQKEGTPFHGVFVPCDKGVGFGNDLMGLSNALLYAIFFKASVFVPSHFGLKNSNDRWDSYYGPKHPVLLNSMTFPPAKDSELKKKISGVVQDQYCILKKVNEKEFYRFMENEGIWGFNYIDEGIHNVNHLKSSDDPYIGWRACTDRICLKIMSNRSSVFHEPLKEGKSFFCTLQWLNGYWAAHLVSNPTKMKFLCEELNLCKGMNLNLLNQHFEDHSASFNPSGGYYRLGFQLLGNIFRELFDFHPRFQQYYDQIRSNIKGKLMSIQIRTHYAGSNVQMIENCVLDVITNEIFSQTNKKNLKDLTLFFTSDGKFNYKEIMKRLQQKVDSLYSDNHSSSSLKLHHLRNVDFGSTNQISLTSSTKSGEDNRLRLLLDFYTQTQASYHVVTEQSTFGMWGAILSDSFLRDHENVYYFRDRQHLGNFNTCYKHLPGMVCPQRHCPLDYEPYIP